MESRIAERSVRMEASPSARSCRRVVLVSGEGGGGLMRGLGEGGE